MTTVPGRIGFIALTDFRIRFRRVSTGVTLIGLLVLAYTMIPDPSSGMALIAVNKRRALMDSTCIASATAVLATTLLSLVGYYLVSNSLTRDIRARTGGIIAATPVRNAEYITGKFLGNMMYLSAVMGVFMICAMAMQVLRGEAPLEPLVFPATFAATSLTGIVFVSAIALVFESIRWLSSKTGDVVYFFLWVFLVAVTVPQAGDPANVSSLSMIDISGITVVSHLIAKVAHNPDISVGLSNFDPTLTPLVLDPFSNWLDFAVMRTLSSIVVLPILGIAVWLFPRFDPVRVRNAGTQRSWNLLRAPNRWAKPIASRLQGLMTKGPSAPFARAVWMETILSLELYPVTIAGIVITTLVSFLLPWQAVLQAVVPAVFGILVLVLADMPTRDASSGMSALLYTIQPMRERYVQVKFAAAVVVALLFLWAPLLRAVAADPGTFVSMLIGCVFTAACATSLGSLSGSSKTFAVCFLLYLYMVVNAKSEPAMDFAGWNGSATAGVRVSYALIATTFVAVAELRHRFVLRR
jgi:hypothetical protein